MTEDKGKAHVLPGISAKADSIWLPGSVTNYLHLHMKSFEVSALLAVGYWRLTP